MNCIHCVDFAEVQKTIDQKTEKIVGEVMTLLEAVITSDRQAEATKSTVKKILWNTAREMKADLEKIATKKEVT